MEGIRNSRFTRAVLLAFAINSDTFQDETYFVLPSNIIRVIMQRRELAEEESPSKGPDFSTILNFKLNINN